MSAPEPRERDPNTADENLERFQQVAEDEETRASHEHGGNLPGGKAMPEEPRRES